MVKIQFYNCKLLNLSSIDIFVDNFSITEVFYTYPRTQKTFQIHLRTALNDVTPLYRGIYNENFVIGMNLKLINPRDEENYKDMKHRGTIEMELTLCDNDVFLSQSDQIQKMQKKNADMQVNFAKQIEKKDQEHEDELRRVSESYMRIIDDNTKKIRELYNKMVVATMKMDDRLLNLIRSMFQSEIQDASGYSEEQIGAETKRIFNKDTKEDEVTSKTEIIPSKKEN